MKIFKTKLTDLTMGQIVIVYCGAYFLSGVIYGTMDALGYEFNTKRKTFVKKPGIKKTN